MIIKIDRKAKVLVNEKKIKSKWKIKKCKIILKKIRNYFRNGLRVLGKKVVVHTQLELGILK